jgi:hypothetical protein
LASGGGENSGDPLQNIRLRERLLLAQSGTIDRLAKKCAALAIRVPLVSLVRPNTHFQMHALPTPVHLRFPKQAGEGRMYATRPLFQWYNCPTAPKYIPDWIQLVGMSAKGEKRIG